MNYTICMNCFAALNGAGVCPQCGFDNSAYAPQAHLLPPGAMLRGRYMVGRALGQGGFGITYAGFDTNLTRKVAIKEYYPDGTVWRISTQTTLVSCYTAAIYQERYDVGIRKCMNEAQSLARLDDIPGIVRVLDYFMENNTAYIIMEFVEGVTLKAFLRQSPQTMSFTQATELLLPVGKALEEVHRRGFVHRDISPDNIMITPSGKTKLLDFGAVKTVTPGGSATVNLVVKRGFSPLELYSTTGKIGPWSDVYAYCATLYHIITNKKVSEPMDRMENDTLDASLSDVVSPDQKSVLEKGLALQPPQRYQNMSELLAALAACQADPVLSPAQSPQSPIQREPSAQAPYQNAPRADQVSQVPSQAPFQRGPVTQAPSQNPFQREPAMQTPSQASFQREPVMQTPSQASFQREPVMQTPSQNPFQRGSVMQTPSQDPFQRGPVMQTPSREPEPQKRIAKKTLIAVIAAAAVLVCIVVAVIAGRSSDNETVTSGPETSSVDEQPSTTADLSDLRVLMGYDEYGDVSVFGSNDYKRSEIVSIEFLDSLSTKPSTGAWDASARQDGSVSAWVKSVADGYALYIAADGKIIANTNCKNMFHGQYDTTETNIYSRVTSISFNNALDTSNVTEMDAMFFMCDSLQRIDFSGFNTSNVQNMNYMFSYCEALQTLDLSGFDTSHVTDMSNMFENCNALQTLDLSSFDTSRVTNMSSMFGCDSLQTLNISSFDTSNVTNMSFMFSMCHSLQTLDLSHFDTSDVTLMHWMFWNCNALRSVDLSSFDTSSVTDMEQMFYECGSLKGLDLRSFSSKSLENYEGIFRGTACEILVDPSKFTVPVEQ